VVAEPPPEVTIPPDAPTPPSGLLPPVAVIPAVFPPVFFEPPIFALLSAGSSPHPSMLADATRQAHIKRRVHFIENLRLLKDLDYFQLLALGF
jgi:hypothetical protein